MLVDFSESTLVDQLADVLKGGVSPGDVWSDKVKHLKSSSVQLDEDSVVDLAKSQKLKNLLDLGRDSVDTTNTDNNSNLTLGLKEEIARLLGSTSGINKRLGDL